MKYRAFLLFGAPGSGKGTQGTALGELPGFVHISTGEMFRNLQPGSEMHRTFTECSAKGHLAPVEFAVRLWREFVQSLISSGKFDPRNDTLILDGIPRNVAQAEIMNAEIDVKRLYYLECLDKEVIYNRLRRRAVLENRIDDLNTEVISNRLRVYEQETYPVLKLYPPCLILRIDTARAPDEVLNEIKADIATIPSHGACHPAMSR